MLAELRRQGLPVPDGVCLTVGAYGRYVRETGLRERIMMELNRKPLSQMRWEEIWDAAFRIRNLFTRTPLPAGQYRVLKAALEDLPFASPFMVRSSAPGEDSGQTSFAGLHDSFTARGGADEIIDKIRLVWASLWSDRALLYRKELNLSGEDSSIAVVIQKLEKGDVSGVGFGVNPNNDDQAVIEAVWGLNQGLVDGTVPPDRWILDRKRGRIISHTPAERKEELVLEDGETVLRSLDRKRSERPPLNENSLRKLFELIAPLEEFLNAPADFEWTFRENELFLLQARPITTGAGGRKSEGKLWEEDDQRPWYLSLSRSFENLKSLRREIEEELIPAMIEEAEGMEATDLTGLSDDELADEIERRKEIRNKWREIYWSEFIPFAHGIRLFGQVYNDAVRPDDPYEFMSLLGAEETESMARNRLLDHLAGLIREDGELRERLDRGEAGSADSQFEKLLDEFMEKYGRLSCGVSQCSTGREGIAAILIRMADGPASEKSAPTDPEKLRNDFLSRFPAGRREKAAEILELGRASYRLRDDDNIHLARIEGELLRAREEGRKRLEASSSGSSALNETNFASGIKRTGSGKQPIRFWGIAEKQRPPAGRPAGQSRFRPGSGAFDP